MPCVVKTESVQNPHCSRPTRHYLRVNGLDGRFRGESLGEFGHGFAKADVLDLAVDVFLRRIIVKDLLLFLAFASTQRSVENEKVEQRNAVRRTRAFSIAVGVVFL